MRLIERAPETIDPSGPVDDLGRGRGSRPSRPLGRLRAAGISVATSVARAASRRYVAGDTIADAERAAAQTGRGVTYGYWNERDDPPYLVRDEYLAGLDALAARPPGDYLSIKLPALDYSRERLEQVAERAGPAGRRLHFDSLAPDTVARTRAAIDELAAGRPDVPLGFTIPGRWARSLGDADWAAERALAVRVVKGQWEDPEDPDRDLREGFLEVVDRLAGRAACVSVATHDVPLAAEAERRLRAAGTACDLELLHGLPMREPLAQADRLGLSVRIYVPYGTAYLPYALRRVRQSPATLLWLARDLGGVALDAARRRRNRAPR